MMITIVYLWVVSPQGPRPSGRGAKGTIRQSFNHAPPVDTQVDPSGLWINWGCNHHCYNPQFPKMSQGTLGNLGIQIGVYNYDDTSRVHSGSRCPLLSYRILRVLRLSRVYLWLTLVLSFLGIPQKEPPMFTMGCRGPLDIIIIAIIRVIHREARERSVQAFGLPMKSTKRTLRGLLDPTGYCRIYLVPPLIRF